MARDGDLRQAVKELATVMYELREGAGHLTCIEAEALAHVLKFVDRGAADAVIEAHAWADDDGDDLHHDRYLELNA